ncbi:hypothetical protein GEOBRER4_n1210 [Citrifermentans bremense]|uniref:Phospholipase A1 n=1 Tax=Citrifermentans bremense TaxID=60035 RepID=A0A6S6M426_9BACT|nr:hypothetical protein [Citrifermentans bremense]BCG46414.1 hypothetical protein GEOBRER4_n1210 [Citrifermentans bremense]
MLVDAIKGVAAPHLARMMSRDLQKAEQGKTAAMRQHEYMVARESILGDLSSMPVSTTQECITNAKAARRKERLDLVSRELVACPKHATEAARLRKDMDEVEYMRCAKHVYLANDPKAPAELRANPPPGFLRPTPEQLKEMGLHDKILAPPDSNFRAAIYLKDPTVWGSNAAPKAVLALRGSTPQEEDWNNNFSQDANHKSLYYQKAVQMGNLLAAMKVSIHIVGHSLGGGLASAVQGGSGLSASTYNAAGLHPATVARYSKDSEHTAAEAEKITAVRVKDEVLTKTQENFVESRGLSLLANEAVGTKRDLAPFHDEAAYRSLKTEGKILGSESYDSYLHGMDEVIAATEKGKTSDEATLKNCSDNRRA